MTGECPVQKGSSSITELELLGSSSKHGMKELIESCKSLKSFKHTHWNSGAGHFNEFYNPTLIRTSLLWAKETLEELWLDYETFDDFEHRNEGQWIGSLQSFARLRKLHIPVHNLFQCDSFVPSQSLADILPWSIETLSITECVDRMVYSVIEQLDNLVSSRGTCAPSIREIEIFARFTNGVNIEEREILLKSLKNRCQKGRIKFKLRKFPFRQFILSRDEFYMLQNAFWTLDSPLCHR